MASKKKLGFKVQASGDTITIDIFDAIGGDPFFGGGVSDKEVRMALDANPNASTVRVRLNSEGGDVFQGMAIYNALRAHPGKKIVEVDTVAASIASIIMLAGDERRITDTGFVMIHNPSAMFLQGTADDLRSKADLLDSIKENMVSIYAERTGQKTAKIVEAMDEETWMNAEEAKAKGFVHKIMSPSAIAARADWNFAKFNKIPQSLMSIVANAQSATQTNEDATAPSAPVQNSKEKRKMQILAGKDVEIAGALLALANANLNAIASADFKAKCDAFVSDLKAMLGEGAASAESAASAASAATEANAKVVEAVKTLTGESDPAKMAAAVSGFKVRAETGASTIGELTARVNTLETEAKSNRAAAVQGKIVALLASNSKKCTPAFEKWAMAQSDDKLVAEVLSTMPVAPVQSVEPPAPGPATSAAPVPAAIALSPEDLEVCRMFGTKPEDFLKEKQARAAAQMG